MESPLVFTSMNQTYSLVLTIFSVAVLLLLGALARFFGFVQNIMPMASVAWTRQTAAGIAGYQLQPLVAPHVSHFSQVPLRTIVKFWHSEHMLPV